MSQPAQSYLICANQRSGTALLCRALADTGVAGHPEEYFLAVDEAANPGWRCWEHGPYGTANGARDRDDYLKIVYRLGTTPNGMFGAKLMWNNVSWAVAKFREMPRFAGLDRAEVLHAAFPDLHVINVTRRDHVRQAVSWARAAQDGVWVVSDDEPATPAQPPEYDSELISNLERLIAEGEHGWRELYRELAATPYEVVYEDLLTVDGYKNVVSEILRYLGIEPSALQVPRPRVHRQTDALNDEWVDRYNAESSSKG